MFISRCAHLTFVMRWILTIVGITLIVSNANGLNIVTTFSNLKDDVKLIAPNDTVLSITKPGVDPHSYQLTPNDVEVLRDADVIISTAHTPFEMKIRELVNSGEIKAKLIEIPRIPGIEILNNPATGLPNYHMPIYDPENYKIFLKYIAEELSKLNPNGRYLERADDVCKEIDELVEKTKKLNCIAVADVPVVQYAVSWLNVSIKYLLLKEPDLPALPDDVRRVEEVIENGEVQVVVVTDSKASKILKDLARKYGIPILYVPSPMTEGSTFGKLIKISNEVKGLRVERVESPSFCIGLAIVGFAVALGLRKL